jgi:predicted outer membrane lipoprotein
MSRNAVWLCFTFAAFGIIAAMWEPVSEAARDWRRNRYHRKIIKRRWTQTWR